MAEGVDVISTADWQTQLLRGKASKYKGKFLQVLLLWAFEHNVKAPMQGVSILLVSPLWVMINVVQFRVPKVTRELLIF